MEESAKYTSDEWTNNIGPNVLVRILSVLNCIRRLELSDLVNDLGTGKGRVVAKSAKLTVHLHDSKQDGENGNGLYGVVVSDLS